MSYHRPSFFHGPAFRTVHTVRSIGAAGLVADVTGLRERGWPGTGWPTDPAAADAAFQAALLWAEHVAGVSMLPMAVGRYHVRRFGPLPDRGQCVVRAGELRGDVARCDVGLLDADGVPRVELVGVEQVRRPR